MSASELFLYALYILVAILGGATVATIGLFLWNKSLFDPRNRSLDRRRRMRDWGTGLLRWRRWVMLAGLVLMLSLAFTSYASYGLVAGVVLVILGILMFTTGRALLTFTKPLERSRR